MDEMSGSEVIDGPKLHKAISYVVVGINTITESKKLFKFLRSNGYADVSLFHDFPDVKDTSDVPISTLDQTASGSSAPLNQIRNSFNGTIEELFSNRDAVSKHVIEKTANSHFCCALCGRHRPLVEARSTAKKKDQNVIFLSCLLMENDVDMDKVAKLYKETLGACRRICQDHYVKAAAFIGREIKEMYGEFPIYGLHNVPVNVLEVFLAHLQVFGDCIDEEVIIETHDVTRFFNECLARYYSADGWNVEEMDAKLKIARKRKQTSSEKELRSEKISPLKQNLHATTPEKEQISPLIIESKEEPPEIYEGISAADLLEQSMPSSSSAATFESTSFRGEELDRLIFETEKDRKNVRGSDRNEPHSTSSAASSTLYKNGLNASDASGDRKFRLRFRMSRNSFKILCDALVSFLEQRHKSAKSSIAIKVGTALEVLAGRGNALKGLNLMGSSVTDIFDEVLDALLAWSRSVIQWPSEDERRKIEKR
ncbi:unnamed protein product [Strongylus vulgaris]|uniref:Uncharacterized protein n=1 Tax=Strongylus vulgaris TaxID=40348 RepID=A0A3P7HZF9_STRVU|nr:unnamed protein product [Strongylus vulgaris]